MTSNEKIKGRKNRSPSDEEILELYLNYKSTLSIHTLYSYKSALKLFKIHCEKQNASFIFADDEMIIKYLAKYDYKSTKESIRIILNIFYKWCIKKEYRKDNPIEEIRHLTGKKGIIEPMRQKDFFKMRNRCESLRRLTFVSMLWYTGMRSKEIRFLRLEDIDQKKGMISISNSKTTTGYRKIPIHRNFKALLEKYYNKRLTLDTDCNYLFLNKFGTQLKGRTLVHFVSEIQVNIDKSKRFSAHDFRRAFITRLYRKTKDLVLCQRLAGHASIKTTRRYVIDDMDEHVRKFNSLNF